MVALLLIAIGTGGMKPCVAAFGGDQFRIPEQEALLEKFFPIFYSTINLGGLIGVILTPILRKSVHCFGNDNCYSVGFGFPAILMTMAVGKCVKILIEVFLLIAHHSIHINIR